MSIGFNYSSLLTCFCRNDKNLQQRKKERSMLQSQIEQQPETQAIHTKGNVVDHEQLLLGEFSNDNHKERIAGIFQSFQNNFKEHVGELLELFIIAKRTSELIKTEATSENELIEMIITTLENFIKENCFLCRKDNGSTDVSQIIMSPKVIFYKIRKFMLSCNNYHNEKAAKEGDIVKKQ